MDIITNYSPLHQRNAICYATYPLQLPSRHSFGTIATRTTAHGAVVPITICIVITCQHTTGSRMHHDFSEHIQMIPDFCIMTDATPTLGNFTRGPHCNDDNDRCHQAGFGTCRLLLTIDCQKVMLHNFPTTIPSCYLLIVLCSELIHSTQCIVEKCPMVIILSSSSLFAAVLVQKVEKHCA